MILYGYSVFYFWNFDLCYIFFGYCWCLRYFSGNIYLNVYGFCCGYWIVFFCYVNCVLFYVKDFVFCLYYDGFFEWNWWFFYVFVF